MVPTVSNRIKLTYQHTKLDLTYIYIEKGSKEINIVPAVDCTQYNISALKHLEKNMRHQAQIYNEICFL